MTTDSAVVSQRLLAGTEEPFSELPPAVFVFNLFIIFNIIEYDQARTLTSPFAATDLLLCAAGDDTELVTVGAFDDDVSFSGGDETFDVKIPLDILVFFQFPCNVAKVFNCHFLCRTDEDDVVFGAEANVGKDKVVSESGGLCVVTRGGGGAGWVPGAITFPTFTVEVGGGLSLIIARGEVDPGEGFDHFGGELHFGLAQFNLQLLQAWRF